jgi:myo-inositol-1(or 4)-monophosphatase
MTHRDFDFLVQLARAAGAATLPQFRKPLATQDKGAGGRYDPVTDADRAAELAVRALIERHFPTDGIIGEEFGTTRAGAPFTWIIDPIDGTRSFISGVPLWGTLVGLMEHGRPRLGMMAQPYTDEIFLGDGNRAELRRESGSGFGGSGPLAVRRGVALADAMLMSTSPRMFDAGQAPRFARVAQVVREVRHGADSYGYCMLAAGHVDLVIEANLQSYDIAPLIPIIEGAGGMVTAWDGGSAADGGEIIAAATLQLHAEALALLGGHG